MKKITATFDPGFQQIEEHFRLFINMFKAFGRGEEGSGPQNLLIFTHFHYIIKTKGEIGGFSQMKNITHCNDIPGTKKNKKIKISCPGKAKATILV
jgi:hypothetical protein